MSGKGILEENTEITYGIKPVIDECSRILNEAFPDTAREEALILISHILSIPKIKLRMEENTLKISGSLKDEIISKTSLRLKHMPVQYILGKAYFFDDEYTVGEGVLIPRSDTEILVQESISIAIRKAQYPYSNDIKEKATTDKASNLNNPNSYKIKDNRKVLRFIEFCTGSGCISISLAKAIVAKGLEPIGVATDISEKALFYARQNLQNIMPRNNIQIIEHDLFSDFKENLFLKSSEFEFSDSQETIFSDSQETIFSDSQVSNIMMESGFDMIISNPPYIKSGILSELQPEVISYEPIIALDGGDDGMKFYRRILELSVKLLNLDGYVLFEIGFDQSQQIEELFKSFGIFDNIYIKEDYSGNPRVAVARRYK